VSRILYSGTKNASSWAFRAWLALREQSIEFEEIVVDIRQPQRKKNLDKVGMFSPPRAVPVLIDDVFVANGGSVATLQQKHLQYNKKTFWMNSYATTFLLLAICVTERLW
jgi:hypothetical protein